MNITVTKDASRGRMIRFMDAYIDDTLMVNVEPTFTNKIYNTEAKSSLDYIFEVTPTATKTKLALNLYFPDKFYTIQTFNNNCKTIRITRFSIAFIVGTFLSWVSAFSLVCGLVAIPLLEKSSLLNTIQALFIVPSELRQPNVLKFAVAEWKEGLFIKEDVYVRMSEKLQGLKDVGKALKYQKTLKIISHPTPSGMQTELLVAEDEFDEAYRGQIGVQIFSKQVKESESTQFDTGEDSKDEGAVVIVRKQMLKWLDAGSDEISVLYQGNGHGSRLSVALTFTFAVGFLSFLLIFGVMQQITSTNVYNTVSSDDIEYEVQPREFIVATMENARPLVSLLDGLFKKTDDVQLVNSSDCLAGLTNEQKAPIINYGKYFYCVN